MIKKIIGSSIIFCLFVALILASFGIHQVKIGAPFLSFLRTCSNHMEAYKIEIPNIPDIPLGTEVGSVWEVLNVLINFFNFLIKILNIIITIVNTLIQVIQFIFAMLFNIESFIEALKVSVVS